VTGIHHVDAGEFDIVPSPGEPKVMRDVDGVLYQAVYGGAGIARYDPAVGEVETLAWIGADVTHPSVLNAHCSEPLSTSYAYTRLSSLPT
jgi:hypothetical protein